MGIANNNLPSGSKILPFTYFDELTQKEYTGKFRFDPITDHDGFHDIHLGYDAELIEARDEKGNEFLDYNCRLVDEFQKAAEGRLYEPPAIFDGRPRVFSIEAESEGIRFCAVVRTSSIPTDEEPYTQVEYLSGAYDPDGNAFNPNDPFVCTRVREALHLAAVNQYRNP
jgi:hypothetical protein